MSKQRTLIALDWLMPVLQDVFDELHHLLNQDDAPMAWQSIADNLHQVSGALTLTNQPLLAQLAVKLERMAQAIDQRALPLTHRSDIIQGLALLQYETQQLQRKQQLHRRWIVERINVFNSVLGESLLELPEDSQSTEVAYVKNQSANVAKADLSLLEQLPVPDINAAWQSDNQAQLVTLWRYCTLQLLKSRRNDPESLETLSKIASYLAVSPVDPAYRQVWHLVSLWSASLAINEKPTPEQYVLILNNLEALIHQASQTLPNMQTARLAVDVLLQLSQFANKTLSAQSLLTSLDLNDNSQNDTLFSQALEKLEKAIFQVNEPEVIYPMLESIKETLANRGWVFYEHQLSQILSDVRMMVEEPAMTSSIAWQVERQLQDLYSQLLETSDTLESQIGLAHFSYAANPQQEAVRTTRVYLENIKLAFNAYTQSHAVNALEVNDNFVQMIQVFGMLGLTRPKELVEQLRLLLNRISKQQLAVLSWEATDAIAEMIARLELFLDYLSHQSVSEDLLNQTQAQLNRANLLVNQLIDKPLEQTQLASRDKVFKANTLIYDDEGEKVVEDRTPTLVTQADDNIIFDDDNVIFDDDDIEMPAISAPIAETQSDTLNTHQAITAPVLATEPSTTEQSDAKQSTTEQSATVVESEALIAARAALKPDDYSADDEIREIFVEEAEEVLSELDDNLPTWQADPSDLATLKEIRRGFHTLKGSGRMVGAFQVGEMAWAVENMLNRVLDNTLPVSDEMVNFITDTRQKIPTLVADFEAQREPSIDPAITVLQASNLLQRQPINTGLAVTSQPTVETAVTIESADNAEQHASIAESTTDAHIGHESVLPDVLQQAYDQLSEVTDEPADPDIQEIYIEEAQEVLETISPLYADWRADPSDTATLKEIRRGFHTLKGSGRMVGANQLGELAWSIENMLNRVLDNTIEIDKGLVSLVGDVIEAFGGFVDIFAQNRTDYPDIVKVWSAIANAYTKKQGDSFDYQAVMAAWQTPRQDSLTNENTLPDSNASALIKPVNRDSESVNDNIPTDELSTVSTEGDDTPDTIFIEEAAELLAKIENFVDSHRHDETVYISDELVRAFHTLRGGAALSQLPRVYALSAALEESLGELLRKEVPLNTEQLALLSEAKVDLAQYLADYESHRPVTEQSGDADDIDELTQQLLSNVDGDDIATHVSVKDFIDLGIDALLDAPQHLSTVFAGKSADIVAYATQLETQADKLADATAQMSYVTIADTLQVGYNKLIRYPEFAKDPTVEAQFLALHEQLISMFDAIAAGLNVMVDDAAIQHFKQVLNDKQYQAELDAIVYEPVVTDIELLEIFLEESEELRKIGGKSFSQWQNNLSSMEAVSELQRLFHTLKGGANMVGIQSIANVARYGEMIYGAIGSGKLESDPEIAIIMHRLNDIVAVQLQFVAEQQRSFFANKFTDQLQAILDKQISVMDVIPDVPLIVEVAQEEQLSNIEITDTESNSEDRSADPLYVQEIINNFEQRRLETWQGHEPDQDILGIFLEEAKELVDSSSQHLQEFRSNTNNIAALQALQRELHTIKGGARMVGAEGLANLAHEMETIYEELGSRRKPSTRMIGNLLAACHDWLASSLYVLENNYNPQTPTPLIRALQDFSKNPDSLKEIPTASLATQIEQIEIFKTGLANELNHVKTRDLSSIPAMSGNFEVQQEQANLNSEMLRISAGLMERMINLSGESAINRARIEMGISSLTNTIEEMGSTVQRLADQLRRMETELEVQILAQIGEEHNLDAEFDPLEMDQYSALNQLSKSLSESASDLLDIKTTMLDKTRDTENLLLQLSRTQTELQEGLMNSRTVPFSRITSRLQRIVRQTATELGKSVELRIINDEGEIDRNILERITSPLEHMLRNAVDHGIEKSQERIESGKSRTGLISLDIQREGGEIVINLSDDGKGINVEAVRKKAIEQGLIDAQDTTLKPLDIMQYIFNAGLSTSSSVTQISGRGVGMDVVQSEVKQLGGVVLVDSEMGRGSRFTMRLPLTVAVSDALVVRAADKYFAVPLVQIERVVRINTETIYQFHSLEATTLDIDGEDYRLRYLNQILYNSDPLESLRQQSVSVPVIIVRTEAGQRMALQVDAIAGSRIEVVVKPLGRQLSHIAGISSATIMGDGSVMLILDLIALMRNANISTKTERQKAQKSADKARKPTVLIIDDSVTVRKVTSRLLERNGYDAQIATDGVDAIEKLQEMTPDIMLLDIEMPRMDGFEVANQVRHTERLKDVPIIMITSRTGEKHRERAMSIGVNEYMGKPFQEQTLLDTIGRLMANSSLQ